MEVWDIDNTTLVWSRKKTFGLRYTSSEPMTSIAMIHQVTQPKFGAIQVIEDFWSAIHEFRVIDVHSYDTPSDSTEIWSDSSYRRVYLLHVHGNLVQRHRETGMVYNKTFGPRYTSSEPMISMPMIPQVSLPLFGVIQVIEGCLCSMSMIICYNDNARPVWSTTRLLVRDRRVQSL